MFPGVALTSYPPSADEWELGNAPIAHYTSTAGLQGIISEGALRASPIKLTNDHAEAAAGEKIVDDLIKSTWTEEGASWLSTAISKHDISSTYFVTCFSEVVDGSSMWQSYGQDGYAIIFDRESLVRSIDAGRATLLRMHYGDEAFADYARREIIEFRSGRGGETRRGIYPGFLKAALKGAEWRGEKEWRLIKTASSYGVDPDDKALKIGFAPGPFGPRPFLRLNILDKSCVRGVVVGPGPCTEERGYSAQWLLSSYGFSHVDVFTSSSTLRP